MPNIMSDVRKALLRVLTGVFCENPAQMALFPCAILYESDNSVAARADGVDYLHSLEYTLEVWARTQEEAQALACAADAQFAALGFARKACVTLFDTATLTCRRVMRYRAFCDENGILTQ